MAICRKCGHSNDDNVKFCGGCGARLDVRQSTPPPLVFDLESDEDSPQAEKREKPQVEEPKQGRTQPRMMHAERSHRSGTLSKSCMLSGCLILLVVFLICGGILAYLIFMNDEKEGRSVLNNIETPEGIVNVDNIEGISSVSLSEDGEEELPVGKEFINRDIKTKIGFSKSEAQDGGEPVYIMYYLMDDTQDYEMVEIQPIGKGRYTVFKSDGTTPDGELYVFPGAKKVRLKSKGEDVIFNIADSSSEDN